MKSKTAEMMNAADLVDMNLISAMAHDRYGVTGFSVSDRDSASLNVRR